MTAFESVTNGHITWHHSKKPLDKAQRKQLRDQFGLLANHVASTERGRTPKPKISSTDKYSYFVLHIPYHPANKKKFYVCELNIFATAKHLITIESQGNLASLNHYFDTTKNSSDAKQRRLKDGTGALLFNITKRMLRELEDSIDEQGEEIDQLNREIFEKRLAKQFIETISVLRYNQNVAYTTLERQARLLDINSNGNQSLTKLNGLTPSKWNQVTETFQTLTYELSSDVQHLESLVKTFESLVTYRTNETIKVLTVFSVISLPLGVTSSVYGMNFIYLPLKEHPFGFFIMLGIMLSLSFTILIFLKLRRWI